MADHADKVLDRRGFLLKTVQKTGDAMLGAGDACVRKRAAHWIRPPFAVPELEFLMLCTRCNACVEACPHDTVFVLGAHTGLQFAGTPALDLKHHACHLCSDWPCVSACRPDALRLPEAMPEAAESAESEPVPRLARMKIDESRCLPYLGPECGACASACPVPGALVFDGIHPRIEAAQCTGCALCRQACVTDPSAVDVASLQAR